MKAPYLGMFVWVLVTILAGAWIQFHTPWMLGWRPNTFLQFVVALMCSLLWFVAGIALEAWLGDRL